jgi:putative transposase
VSLDFVHDQFACGRRFRVLNVMEDVTEECLAAIPGTSISGRRVARELTTLVERRGKPGMIVSDNATELTPNAILTWCPDAKVAWHDIAPRKPMQNGIVECLNDQIRDKFLNDELFRNPHPCPRTDGGMGHRLQHRASALRAWLQNPRRLRPAPDQNATALPAARDEGSARRAIAQAAPTCINPNRNPVAAG